jgi:hypothetical protein
MAVMTTPGQMSLILHCPYKRDRCVLRIKYFSGLGSPFFYNLNALGVSSYVALECLRIYLAISVEIKSMHQCAGSRN